MINIGIDVHVRNCFVHGQDETGRTVVRGRCATDLAGLAQRLAPVEGLDQPVRVVIESTTNSRGVARLLQTYGQQACVDLTVTMLDARRLRIIAESVNKTDALDAQVLCELAGSNLRLPVCYLPDDEVFALREHLRARSDLVRIRTMLKNRVHAVMHRRAIQLPRGGLFTRAGRTWLAEVHLDEAGRSIVDRYLAQVDGLDATIKTSTNELKQLMHRPRWAKPAALLQTMPGVGLLTALTVLAELGDLGRFQGRAAVANYAGLTPTVRDSAQTVFPRAIRLAEAALEHDPRDTYARSNLATYHARLGQRRQAEAHLAQVEAGPDPTAEEMFIIADAYGQIGERDQALHWLERACAAGLSAAKVELYPGLHGLRADERFQEIINRH